MPKIKLLVDTRIATTNSEGQKVGEAYPAGSVLDVSKEDAALLVSIEKAKLTDEPLSIAPQPDAAAIAAAQTATGAASAKTAA